MPRRANIRPDEPGRERIVEAGREVFGERGFDAASIAEIGRRAGVAKSVLYHYFGSKAGLYRALLESDRQALVEAVAAAVPADRSATPRLRPGVDAFLRFLSEHRGTWRLVTREAPADPELRELHEQVSESVSTALRELLALPSKTEEHPELVDLVALAIRTYALWWYDHPDVPREDVREAIMDVAVASARRIHAGTHSALQ